MTALQLYQMARSPFVLGSLILLGLLAAVSTLPCDSWNFDEDIVFAGGLGKVNGLGLIYHPYNPATNAPDLQTSITWRLGNFEETDSTQGMPTKCDVEKNYPSEVGARIWRTMNISALVCDVSRGSRELVPGITQSYVSVAAHWPAYPNFSLVLEISAVNTNWTLNHGQSPKTDGYDYIIDFEPENLKTSLTIENWPWGGPNGTSFVVASFVGVVQAHDSFGNLSAELVTQESQLSVNTSRYRLAMQSTLFLLLDEMPVLKSFSPGMYRTRGPIGVPTPIAYFSTLSVCRHNEPGILPHWRKLWYDPQFSSIFLGSSALDPTLDAQTTPTEKTNRKVVAIAAGVSVGAVAILGVAAAIVYFKWYHRTPAKPAVTL